MPKRFTAHFNSSHRSSSASSSSRSQVIQFTIPSSHDGNLIEGRVYHPPNDLLEKDGDGGGGIIKRVAMMAHPYAPLGGNMNDPIVKTATNALLRKGFIVATFNFRGAGNSQGKTSWTSAPEMEDYATIGTFLLAYALFLNRHHDASTKTSKIDVVLGGYSYGSMIASRIQFAMLVARSLSDDIRTFAKHTAHEWCSSYSGNRDIILVQNEKGEWRNELYHPAASDEENKEQLSECDIDFANLSTSTSYLLISPLLPPVSTALALSMPTLWSSKPEQQETQEQKHRTLAVYGTSDMFVSIGKLQAWADKRVKEDGDGFFKGVEVAHATHFWTNSGDDGGDKLEELKSAVVEWLDWIATQ